MTTIMQSAMQTVRCSGFNTKRKRQCTYVFGRCNGDFEGPCPKCYTLMRHFHQRIEVIPAKIQS